MSSRLAWITPALIGLLALRLALGIYYVFAVPPWESYDEPGHYQYARYIAVTGHLLDPNDPEATRIWSRFQPPLYYLIVAPVLSTFDLGERALEPVTNPLLMNGVAGLNHAIAPVAVTADVASQLAALQAMRLVGVVISTISVTFVFLAAVRLWPGRPSISLAVAGLYAFWPQFVFIGSMATNDLLITSLAAVLVYGVIRIRQDGLTALNVGLLAVVTGCAILTKLNGLAFVIPSGLAIIYGLMAAHRPRRAALFAIIGLIALIAIALTILQGMHFVTDQVFQLATLVRFLDNLTQTDLLQGRLWDILTYGLKTFVASYGWGNVETWAPVYPIANAWLFVGLVGFGVTLWRRPKEMAPGTRTDLILASIVLLSLVTLALALAIAQNDANLFVGRYLLPALPGLILLIAGGWSALLPQRWLGGFLVVSALVVALVSASAPAGIFAVVYGQPQAATAADLAAIDARSSAVFAPGMRLLGATLAEADGPETLVAARLCWQADRAIDRNYPLQVTVIGPDGQGYGDLTSYTGRGNYPTTLWKPNQPFCETYNWPVRGDYPAPSVGHIKVVFLTSDLDDTAIVATDLNGAVLPDGPSIPAVIHGQSQAEASPVDESLGLRFGDSIVLETVSLTPRADGQGIDAVLVWRCDGPIADDVQVFAHLRSSPTELVAQDDSRPREDHYPTIYWRTGETIIDRRVLIADVQAASDLAFYVGMYTTAGRLPAISANGERLLNDELVLPIDRAP